MHNAPPEAACHAAEQQRDAKVSVIAIVTVVIAVPNWLS
jgi:hypothetical protein